MATFSLSAQDENPLTFEQVWDAVRTTNPSLEAARTETHRQIAEQRSAQSLRGPQIEAVSRYTRIDESIDIDLDSIRSVLLSLHPSVSTEAIPSFILPVQEQTYTEAQITAVWPIYAGGRIRAAQTAAAAAVAGAEASQRHTHDALFSETVSRYYGAQLSRVVHAMRVETLAGLERHLHQAELLESEGQIARTERLHAQVARDEAQRELLEASTQVNIAERAVAGLFGHPTPVTPDSPLFMLTSPLPPLAQFVAAAEEDHPALALLHAKHEQAKAGVAAARGKLKPEIYLFGVKELDRGDLTLLEPDWAAGVGMKLVLFDRNDRTHRITSARLQARQIELLTTDLRNNLRVLVEQAHREAELARQQFASLESTLELTRENLRVRNLAFQEGQSTSLDVVDARLALQRAQTARALAAARYDIALARLLEASGQPDRYHDYAARASHRLSP